MRKNISLFTPIALCLIFLMTLSAQAAEPNTKIVYKRTMHGPLKLHIFNPKGHTRNDKKPAIVFFFGGGWKTGKASQFYPQSKHLASRGMVAICAEYRIKSKHKTEPKVCVMDAKSAVRWVRKNATKLGVDPNRIAAGGGSAGGHIAAAAGLIEGMEQKNESKETSSKPNALVLFNPVLDNGPGEWGHQTVKAYWQKISPAHHVRKNQPPTILFLGTKDPLIPVKTLERFTKAMKQAGNRCELKLYKGQGHGFFNVARYKETVQAMDDFLVSLGYLTPLPKQAKTNTKPQKQTQTIAESGLPKKR